MQSCPDVGARRKSNQRGVQRPHGQCAPQLHSAIEVARFGDQGLQDGKPCSGVQTAPLMRQIVGREARAGKHADRTETKRLAGLCKERSDFVTAWLHILVTAVPVTCNSIPDATAIVYPTVGVKGYSFGVISKRQAIRRNKKHPVVV